jgi:DNA-directed RNA polymerase subunit RPC12/RpoP
VRGSKPALRCPVCGSADVFYSCTPNCCFNHVCGACGATFEPVTAALAGSGSVDPPDPLPDASDPTVECAKCQSTAVYQVEEDLVCSKCGARLAVEYTEVSPA